MRETNYDFILFLFADASHDETRENNFTADKVEKMKLTINGGNERSEEIEIILCIESKRQIVKWQTDYWKWTRWRLRRLISSFYSMAFSSTHHRVIYSTTDLCPLRSHSMKLQVIFFSPTAAKIVQIKEEKKNS